MRPPPTRRPRAHHRVNPYLGARRQNVTKMFSDRDETSPSIAAVSALSGIACSMLAVQQQKRLCRQFVDVSAARRGCVASLWLVSPGAVNGVALFKLKGGAFLVIVLDYRHHSHPLRLSR